MNSGNEQAPYGYNYIYDNLKTLKEQEFLRLCMPGHKGILPEEILDAGLDVTEIGENDDLHAPVGVIKKAQERAARIFDAGYTFFVTGGATSAMHIMLAAPGSGRLIAAGDFHKSAVYGMGLADISPVFCGADEPSVRAALAENPDAMGVLITSPDYYGNCADIMAIGKTVKQRDKLLLIDESHGGHFYFGGFPATAAKAGADMWVNSLHKTLPCLTQSAVLNVGKNGGVFYANVRAAFAAMHTSSPSYLLLASIENGLGAMCAADAAEWIGRCSRAMEAIDALGGYVCARGIDRDPTRIVIDTARRGWAGFDALEALKKRGVLCEMADERRVVLLTANVDFEKRLLDALNGLERRSPAQVTDVRSISAAQRNGWAYPMRIREAMFARNELVSISKSVGRIAACAAGAYPPGTPDIIPGQRIDEMAAALLSRARPMFGLNEGRVMVVR